MPDVSDEIEPHADVRVRGRAQPGRGSRAGRKAQLSVSDFLPTLAELAHAPLPEDVHLDGRSFAAQLKGQPGKPRHWVFCEHQGRRWVRTHCWKLYDDGKLFDMQADPLEKHPIDRAQESPEAATARRNLQGAALGSLVIRPK
jgi:arylsulfatase A-like enzyme